MVRERPASRSAHSMGSLYQQLWISPGRTRLLVSSTAAVQEPVHESPLIAAASGALREIIGAGAWVGGDATEPQCNVRESRMAFEPKEINLNDLIPVGAWGVGVIHGQTPDGPASYVVVAPQPEVADGNQPPLHPLVMTAELAEQLIEMLRTQVTMIRSGDPFGGMAPSPVKM
jgi:hypothetical protein